MRYFLIIIFSVSSFFLNAEESLGKLLFAVHATDQLPINGMLYAGYGIPEEIPEGIPNIRRTLHFAIGEVVRPIGTGEDEWMTWENKPYAIVVPLENLYPQLINLNCYDTFILGDLTLTHEMFIVAPRGTVLSGPDLLFEYDTTETLREAVDTLIASQGGWKVTMSAENLDENYAPAFVDGININTYEFFTNILDQLPYLSLGIRWEPLHGEAWRFANLEMRIMGLALQPEYFQNWDEVNEHLAVFGEIYLNAPLFSEKSKATLREIIKLIDEMKEQNLRK
jgi:hypothetical protein